MANYYEILKIQPSASAAEITAAIDAQYNQWRRLVTHHDPNIVNQANQALGHIERIRATLTDPEKRSIYDTAIGVANQQIGGLADPEALLNAPGVTGVSPNLGMAKAPPSSPAPGAPAAPAAGARLDAWECSKCKAQNPIGTRFCKKCGAQIGIDCPNCKNLAEAAAKHCSNCGVDLQKALQKKKADEEERARLAVLQQAEEQKRQQEAVRLRSEQASVSTVQKKKTSRTGCLIGVALVGMGICVVLGLASYLPKLMAGNNTPLSAVIAVPTVDPIIAAMNPGWQDANSQITVFLNNASDDRFDIGLKFKNLNAAAQVITLLSSDITVSDNLGNTYPANESTRTIRDDVGSANSYGDEQDYSFSFKGFIPAEVTELTVHIAQINDVKNLDFKIAVPALSNQLEVKYDAPGCSDDYIRMNGQILNNAPYNFLVRFKASEFTLTDDVGNTYTLDPNNATYQGFRLLTPGYNLSDYETFTPGVDPRAKTLSFQTPMMGKPITQTFDLGTASDKVRYEAKIDYQYSDSFAISFTIFNLGDTDLIARYDANLITLSSPSGQSYSPDERLKRKVYAIRSGGQESVSLTFTGNLTDTNGVTLTIPVLSGVENVQVPVTAK
jgi:hypothetical protein